VVSAVGYIAGFFTTLAFLPQVIRSWRTGSTADLSLTTVLAFTTGTVLWITYGIQERSDPIIIWNVITLMLNLGILIAKLRNG
jgi:MtN3 and saliva related transmembrane protein